MKMLSFKFGPSFNGSKRFIHEQLLRCVCVDFYIHNLKSGSKIQNWTPKNPVSDLIMKIGCIH